MKTSRTIGMLALICSATTAFAENDPPVTAFSVPSPQVVTSGSNLTFTVSVTDTNRGRPALTITNWQNGYHLDGSVGNGYANYTFSYTPTAGAMMGFQQDVAFVATTGDSPAAVKTMAIVVMPGFVSPVLLVNAVCETGRFKFDIAGGASKGVIGVLQASTNNVDWESIQVLYGSDSTDLDPTNSAELDATTFAQQFFRVWQR
jgi:hypothetical protein